jgi:hypothetical protein
VYGHPLGMSAPASRSPLSGLLRPRDLRRGCAFRSGNWRQSLALSPSSPSDAIETEVGYVEHGTRGLGVQQKNSSVPTISASSASGP